MENKMETKIKENPLNKLDRDGVFWLYLWRTAFWCIVAIILTISGCIMYEDRIVKDTIISGKATPLETRTAFKAVTNSEIISAWILQNMKKD